MTSGLARRSWWLAYAILAILTLLVCTVNALSVLDESAWLHRSLQWWEPVTWEGTSAAATIAFAWIPGTLIARFPPTPKAASLFPVHVAGSIVFSACHVMAMIAARDIIYFGMGRRYHFGGSGALLYEYRKDAIDYILFAALFWAVPLFLKKQAQPSLMASEKITIDEGPRTIRVDSGQVLAVKSCGNYVEYWLGDGRRPLVRSTLLAAASGLAAHGFVRVHRSWLVNADRISTIEPEHSGDYALTLESGIQVPMSRRYRSALDLIRHRA